MTTIYQFPISFFVWESPKYQNQKWAAVVKFHHRRESQPLPPSQMLDGSTAKISIQDLLKIWKNKEKWEALNEVDRESRVTFQQVQIRCRCAAVLPYRVDDSLQRLEAIVDREDVILAVGDGGELQARRLTGSPPPITNRLLGSLLDDSPASRWSPSPPRSRRWRPAVALGPPDVREEQQWSSKLVLDCKVLQWATTQWLLAWLGSPLAVPGQTDSPSARRLSGRWWRWPSGNLLVRHMEDQTAASWSLPKDTLSH